MSDDFSEYVSTLRQQVDHHFNLSELKILSFDLGIDYEHLAGDSKLPKIQNLILHFSRRGRLREFVTACAKARPAITWPDTPPTEVQIAESKKLELQAPGQTNIHIAGNVGPGSAVGPGAKVEAQNIAGRDVNVYGDQVQGDKVSGDKVQGDKIITVTFEAPPQLLSPAGTQERRDLGILLRKVKQFWIDGVLENSIHNIALNKKKKETQADAVAHVWEQVLELPDQSRQT
ncbi:MAG: hypothetical protein GY927_15630, partial [bacterium]|nr:hypothetical protein [bacterium]